MEFNSNRKAALAVTAGLVGALTLGGAAVAPVAYADDAALTSVQPGGSDIESLGVDDGQGGAVSEVDGTYVLKANTNTWLNVALESDQKATYYADVQGDPAPSPLTGYTSGKPVTDSNASYYFGGESSASSQDAVKDGEAYWVIVTDANGDEVTRARFKYAEQQVTYTALNANGGTGFTYNGSNQAPAAYKGSDGKTVELTDSGVTVSYIDADGSAAPSVGPVAAGSYTAKLTVSGKTYDVPFTIEALDLTKASVSLPDYLAAGTGAPTSASDFLSKAGLPSTAVKVTKLTSPGNVWGQAKSGAFTVEFADADAADPNVTGNGSYTYYVLDETLLKSDGESAAYGVTAPANDYSIDLSLGQAFDASKVKFLGSDGKTYRGDQIEVTYKDINTGKAVDASALGNPGDYTVTVRVKPFTQNDQFVGGSDTFDVHVAAASIVANEGVTFKHDGEVVADKSGKAGVTVDYDGSDVLKSITTEVKDSDGKAYEAGKDYKVVVTKGNKEVDKIVDAGEYKVTVEPVTFQKGDTNDSDWQLTVEVEPAQIGQLVDYTVESAAEDSGTKLTALLYTGSAIEAPQAQYATADGNVAVPADAYEVVSLKKGDKSVKEIKDAGKYVVKIAVKDAAKGNYKLADREFEVTVSKFDKAFVDVSAPAWYAKAVSQAWVNGYVNGISGTETFAPTAKITRADAVCILFNMAGGKNFQGDLEFSYSDQFGWQTGFKDVNGKAYYAKALAWAKAYGVASGYGDGTFKPNAQITREEFASFLMKYAKMSGKYAAPSGDALSGFADASAVSPWAESAVNWAVSNRVMGNGGSISAQSQILRAEVATMAVNFQPKPLVK